MWTAQMGPCVGGSQPYVRARAAWVGRYASVEARARRPLASDASTSKAADRPPRQRTSSSPQRARPIPGTGRGVEGSTLTRQRVVAAVGCTNSAAVLRKKPAPGDAGRYMHHRSPSKPEGDLGRWWLIEQRRQSGTTLTSASRQLRSLLRPTL